jgi:hypothetical protein
MGENKTKPTDQSVSTFVGGLASEARQAEARTLIDMMSEATGEAPQMWGPSIIGFGTSSYAYESGRTGTTPIVSFSPRKAAIVLYVGAAMPDIGDLVRDLGKHTTGKACLYMKRLSDVDLAVLKSIIEAEVAASRANNKP